jgi:hypothetical protein
VPRISLEDLAVEVLGVGEIAFLMVFQRQGRQLGNGGHEVIPDVC